MPGVRRQRLHSELEGQLMGLSELKQMPYIVLSKL